MVEDAPLDVGADATRACWKHWKADHVRCATYVGVCMSMCAHMHVCRYTYVYTCVLLYAFWCLYHVRTALPDELAIMLEDVPVCGATGAASACWVHWNANHVR